MHTQTLILLSCKKKKIGISVQLEFEGVVPFNKQSHSRPKDTKLQSDVNHH